MIRSRRAAALLVLLALAVALPAQPETQDAGRRFKDILDGISAREKEQMAEEARRMNAMLAGVKPFLLVGEALQSAGRNDDAAAAAKLDQAIGEFEKKPLAQLSGAEAAVYRDALMERGRLHALAGKHDEGAGLADRGWEVHGKMRRPAPPGSVDDELDHVQAALKAAGVYAACGRPHEASLHADEALSRCESPDGPLRGLQQNPLLAYCWLLKGALSQVAGNAEVARSLCDKALQAFLKRFPPASYPAAPEVMAARTALAAALADLGDGPRAMVEIQQAQTALEESAAKDHAALSVVYRVRARLHIQRSEALEALDDINRAQRELEARFPRAHPEVIQTRTALSGLLNQLGKRDRARKLDKENLDTCAELYRGEPHETTVLAHLNAGRTLRDGGDLKGALKHFQQAEEMARKLGGAGRHPGGPALLAQCLLHLGALHARMGQRPLAREALQPAAAMYRELPGGRPLLALVSCYLGLLALQDGNAAAAGGYFAAALEADQEELRNLIRAAAEAEALTFMDHRRLALAGYLTAARGDHGADERAFAATWAAQGAVTRVAEAWRLALRLAQSDSPEVRRLHRDHQDCCAQLRDVLYNGNESATVRDLTEKRDRLLVQIADRRPDLRSPPAYERRRPGDLAAALPPATTLIHFVRYDDLGAGDAMRPRYAAFVAAAGRKPVRIDVGEAGAIDQRVGEWLKAAAAWPDQPGPRNRQAQEDICARCGAQLHELVWAPLAKALEGTEVIYLVLDGELARFPFAALPGREPGTILLEDYTLGTVPHGPFLLDQLDAAAAPAPDAPVDFLAVGELDYGPPPGAERAPYGFLSLSGVGLALADDAVALGRARTLRAREATYSAVCREWPRARVAHLATHGYYDAGGLRAAAGRLRQYVTDWSPDRPGAGKLGGAARRFPLSYVGLALSGANAPKTAEHSGILTGEVIAQLPLDHVSLVVLDACDTGAGEGTPGEGPQALQRAVHLAGCPNVVATLWEVSDDSASVVCHEFYRQLWGQAEGPTTLEALHRAQLAVYYHPERLTGSGPRRGPLLPVGAADEPAREPSTAREPGARAPAPAWAAYVHSGAGRRVSVPLRAPIAAAPPVGPTPGPAAAGDPSRWPWAVGGLLALLLAAAGCWRLARRLRAPATVLTPPTAILLPAPDPGEGGTDSSGPSAPLAVPLAEPGPSAGGPAR